MPNCTFGSSGGLCLSAACGQRGRRWLDNGATRVVVIQHRIPIVYKKYRPLATRYSIPNTRVELCAPEEVFSEDERKNISRFAERIGMDFGELDVLRDRNTGHIYVIDANNTPMGPAKALNKEEASRTFAVLLPAFRRLLDAER